MVGLGNPGGRYAATRHNVGYRVVDELAERLGTSVIDARWRAMVGRARRDDATVWLMKPITWMNESGRALRAAVAGLGIDIEEMLVIFDDFHLDLGQLRLRRSGSAGGHNGVESVISALATDSFARIRIGIGHAPAQRAMDYVLGEFRADEEDTVDGALVSAADAALVWIDSGIDEAMNAFN